MIAGIFFNITAGFDSFNIVQLVVKKSHTKLLAGGGFIYKVHHKIILCLYFT